MASAITFTGLNFTGTPSQDDSLAAKLVISNENQRLAELIPPGTPFPSDTPANIKASYLTILINGVTASHSTSISLSKTAVGLRQVFTAAELDQIAANLVSRRNAGETSASIVTDTAS